MNNMQINRYRNIVQNSETNHTKSVENDRTSHKHSQWNGFNTEITEKSLLMKERILKINKALKCQRI
jgi:hypothetical protein